MEKQIKKILEALEIKNISPMQYTIVEGILEEVHGDGYFDGELYGDDSGYKRGYLEGYDEAKSQYSNKKAKE